ncbi:MAG: hypothetical protein E7027_05560 [Elusimicrobium sp.]|uniref:Uncharacterized protein n=1 Tax=Candidatus Avelusimicrobium gallicola TaxID=2562704 RepID=A0A928DQH1_9BACT|nr:hypothetical protein [Elusimicrobium sp.]
MRKIKRFKISPRQKEILRKLLRGGGLLRQAGFSSELEVTQYILSAFALLDPGVVYEFNQDAHWELDGDSSIHKEMFSACAVTLGSKLEPFLQEARAHGEPRNIVAGTIALEFLKNAVTFITDLVKEQATKEEYDTLEPQFVYLPPFGIAAPPKLLRESVRLEKNLAEKTLPILLSKLNADKIDLVYADGAFTPAYTTVFLVPWQKRKKGKK